MTSQFGRPHLLQAVSGHEEHQVCSYACILPLGAMPLPSQSHDHVNKHQTPSCLYMYLQHRCCPHCATANMECMSGASRYSVFADAIAHTIWELSPWGARNSQPPPEAAPAVDFELLDMADESGLIDVAQVSDWVETKINSFCKLAEVHAPDLALCIWYTPDCEWIDTIYSLGWGSQSDSLEIPV